MRDKGRGQRGRGLRSAPRGARPRSAAVPRAVWAHASGQQARGMRPRGRLSSPCAARTVRLRHSRSTASTRSSSVVSSGASIPMALTPGRAASSPPRVGPGPPARPPAPSAWLTCLPLLSTLPITSRSVISRALFLSLPRTGRNRIAANFFKICRRVVNAHLARLQEVWGSPAILRTASVPSRSSKPPLS